MNRHHSEGISFPLSIGLPMLKHILQGVGSAKQFAEGVRQHDEGANGQAHSLEEDIITYKVFTLWNRICNIRGLRERTTQSRYKFDENGLSGRELLSGRYTITAGTYLSLTVSL